MTIIAAMAAGNALAWMIHSTTWWLRRHCLWLMVVAGVLGVAGSVVLSCFFVLLLAWGQAVTQAQFERNICITIIVVWTGFAFLGWLHAPQLREGRRRSVKLWLAATLCAFAEVELAWLMGIWSANVLGWSHGPWRRVDYFWFSASLAVTLLLLSLLRPLVVRVGKLLSEMLRETFRWSHTAG